MNRQTEPTTFEDELKALDRMAQQGRLGQNLRLMAANLTDVTLPVFVAALAKKGFQALSQGTGPKKAAELLLRPAT